MLTLDISNQAVDFVAGLASKQAGQIAKRVFALLATPRPKDSESLSGYSGVYRVDQGEFRIGYSFDKTVLRIEAIGPRNDDEIYKILKRKIK